jgi:anti-anti-sigma regulatory factor
MGAKATHAGGGLIVVFGMAEVVRKVFLLSGFLRIMTVVESEAEAEALAAAA